MAFTETSRRQITSNVNKKKIEDKITQAIANKVGQKCNLKRCTYDYATSENQYLLYKIQKRTIQMKRRGEGETRSGGEGETRRGGDEERGRRGDEETRSGCIGNTESSQASFCPQVPKSPSPQVPKSPSPLLVVNI